VSSSRPSRATTQRTPRPDTSAGGAGYPARVAVPDVSPPAACILDAEAVGDRENAFRAPFARSLQFVERRDALSARIVLDAAYESEARDLFAREQRCCAFFDFTVALVGRTVVVDARVPADADESLDYLLRLARVD
jgi:hypothetical protein